MSIFVYLILHLRSVISMWYHTTVYRYFKRAYTDLYYGSVVEINTFDTIYLHRKPVMALSWWTIAKNGAQRYLYRDDTYKVEVFEATPPKFSTVCGIRPLLHQVRCWDGKSYLVRDRFVIAERPIFSRRRAVLHASICDIVDVTKFINDHAESFTKENNITLHDVLCVLYAAGYVSHCKFHSVLEHVPFPFLYVIDDNTFEVTTFKDYDPIILTP